MEVRDLEMLIKKGASVNAVDKMGWTPIHEAARAGRLDVIKLLLRNGARLDAGTQMVTGAHGTPLVWATEALGADHEVSRFLVNGAQWQSDDALQEGAKAGGKDIESLKMLIKKGASVNAVDGLGWGPIHEAARAGRLDVIKMLVSHGARLETPTAEGTTALWWARLIHGADHEVSRYLSASPAPTRHDEL